MKNATPRIDRTKKTIYATKSFLIKAGQFGTTEFNTLNDMLKTFPGYKVDEEKIARNASKEAYGDLTYEKMKQFIEGYETDDTKRKMMLEEYENIKVISKTQRGAYAYVKSWFLMKCLAIILVLNWLMKDRETPLFARRKGVDLL